MRHARADYQRIQDPAANAELLAAFQTASNLVARGPRMATGLQDSTALTREAYTVLSQLTRALHATLGPLIRTDVPPVTPIGDDEPVFLLRARDRYAPDTVRDWCARSYEQGNGVDERVRIAVQAVADAMEAYAAAHGGAKVPDTPEYVALVDPANGATVTTPPWGARLPDASKQSTMAGDIARQIEGTNGGIEPR